jgi:hypothetical protein
MTNLNEKLSDSYLRVRKYGIKKGLDITFNKNISYDDFKKNLKIDNLSKTEIAELLSDHAILILDVLTDNYDFVYLLIDTQESNNSSLDVLKHCKVRRLIVDGKAKPEFFRDDLEINVLDLIDNIKKEENGFKNILIGEL